MLLIRSKNLCRCQAENPLKLLSEFARPALTALAIEAFAPPMETFKNGRAFAAWLGLVPRQFSSGGKERLGGVSKADLP
jgi:Transposase IS116/IS110/IS902 family